MSLRTRALLPVCTAAVLLLAATASHAAIPQLNAQCPSGIDVHADAGGPVFVQGRQAQLKRFSDAYYEARDTRTALVLSLSVAPDGTPSLSYTGPQGANGVCTISGAAPGGTPDVSMSPADGRHHGHEDDEHLPSVVTCESTGQQQHACAMDTRGTVVVRRQLSRNRCVEGESWGLARHSVWVSAGCRAEFANTSAASAPTAAIGQGALAACNARNGGNGRLVTQLPVGERYTEVIVDYDDGRQLCMVGNDGTVLSLTPMRRR